MSCSHILVYPTCFIALLGINKVICCLYCSVAIYPFGFLAGVVHQYHPGYYRSPAEKPGVLYLLRAADAHCTDGRFNSKRAGVQRSIGWLKCSLFDFFPDLARLLVCKSRSRGPQERGEVQMRCRGRARVTIGPWGLGTAPKMGVPGGASIWPVLSCSYCL